MGQKLSNDANAYFDLNALVTELLCKSSSFSRTQTDKDLKRLIEIELGAGGAAAQGATSPSYESSHAGNMKGLEDPYALGNMSESNSKAAITSPDILSPNSKKRVLGTSNLVSIQSDAHAHPHHILNHSSSNEKREEKEKEKDKDKERPSASLAGKNFFHVVKSALHGARNITSMSQFEETKTGPFLPLSIPTLYLVDTNKDGHIDDTEVAKTMKRWIKTRAEARASFHSMPKWRKSILLESVKALATKRESGVLTLFAVRRILKEARSCTVWCDTDEQDDSFQKQSQGKDVLAVNWLKREGSSKRSRNRDNSKRSMNIQLGDDIDIETGVDLLNMSERQRSIASSATGYKGDIDKATLEEYVVSVLAAEEVLKADHQTLFQLFESGGKLERKRFAKWLWVLVSRSRSSMDSSNKSTRNIPDTQGKTESTTDTPPISEKIPSAAGPLSIRSLASTAGRKESVKESNLAKVPISAADINRLASTGDESLEFSGSIVSNPDNTGGVISSCVDLDSLCQLLQLLHEDCLSIETLTLSLEGETEQQHQRAHPYLSIDLDQAQDLGDILFRNELNPIELFDATGRALISSIRFASFASPVLSQGSSYVLYDQDGLMDMNFHDDELVVGLKTKKESSSSRFSLTGPSNNRRSLEGHRNSLSSGTMSSGHRASNTANAASNTANAASTAGGGNPRGGGGGGGGGKVYFAGNIGSAGSGLSFGPANTPPASSTPGSAALNDPNNEFGSLTLTPRSLRKQVSKKMVGTRFASRYATDEEMTLPEFLVFADMVSRAYSLRSRERMREVGWYELRRELGTGAQGVVHLGRDISTGAQVAIKTISRIDANEPFDTVMMRNPVVTGVLDVMTLLHGVPNVIKYKKVIATTEQVHFVIDMAAGGSVFDVLMYLQTAQLDMEKLASKPSQRNSMMQTPRRGSTERSSLEKARRSTEGTAQAGSNVAPPASQRWSILLPRSTPESTPFQIQMLPMFPLVTEDVGRGMFRSLVAVVATMHSRNVCHRDLRLHNMLMDNAGDMFLIDFDSSAIFSPGWDIFSGETLVGSLYFQAPEQIQGTCYGGMKADVWALGVILYWLFQGRPPFFGDTPRQTFDAIRASRWDIFNAPQGVVKLLQRIFVKDPDSRPTAREVLEDPWVQGTEVSLLTKCLCEYTCNIPLPYLMDCHDDPVFVHNIVRRTISGMLLESEKLFLVHETKIGDVAEDNQSTLRFCILFPEMEFSLSVSLIWLKKDTLLSMYTEASGMIATSSSSKTVPSNHVQMLESQWDDHGLSLTTSGLIVDDPDSSLRTGSPPGSVAVEDRKSSMTAGGTNVVNGKSTSDMGSGNVDSPSASRLSMRLSGALNGEHNSSTLEDRKPKKKVELMIHVGSEKAIGFIPCLKFQRIFGGGGAFVKASRKVMHLFLTKLRHQMEEESRFLNIRRSIGAFSPRASLQGRPTQSGQRVSGQHGSLASASGDVAPKSGRRFSAATPATSTHNAVTSVAAAVTLSNRSHTPDSTSEAEKRNKVARWLNAKLKKGGK